MAFFSEKFFAKKPDEPIKEVTKTKNNEHADTEGNTEIPQENKGKEVTTIKEYPEYYDREHEIHRYEDPSSGFAMVALSKNSKYLSEEIKKLEAEGFKKSGEGERAMVFIKEKPGVNTAKIIGQDSNDFIQPAL